MRKACLYDGILFATLICASTETFAYRPFDNTDAAVADLGEFELELGPFGYLQQGVGHYLIAPNVVANWGIPGEREIVLQGNGQTLLNTDPGQPKSSVTDTGIFLKQVLRDGVLQDKSGVSIALETGILLPEFNGQSGTGLSADAIFSEKSELGAMHLNTQWSLTRDHHNDLMIAGIFEGPDSWTVRPVAEIIGDHEYVANVRTFSKLIGAIWRVNDKLSFDAGFRQAREGNEGVHEVRLGFTWSF
jgi:hypothetical protein